MAKTTEKPDLEKLKRIIQTIDIKKVYPSEMNPRKYFDPVDIEELSESIKKDGLIQAITVRPGKPKGCFEIVAGERRWRASVMAGLLTIDAEVKELDDQKMADIQIIENLQRKDITALEEARAYKYLMDKFGYTINELAERFSVSYDYVDQRLKLLDMDQLFIDLLEKRVISFTHARMLSRVGQHVQLDIYENYFKDPEDWKYNPEPKQLRNIIDEEYSQKLELANWDLDDAELDKVAGACNGCPKRSDCHGMLFQDSTKEPVCLDVVCFNNKGTTFIKNQIKKHKQEEGVVFVYYPYRKFSKGVEEYLNRTKLMRHRVSSWDTGCMDVEDYNRTDRDGKEVALEEYYQKAEKKGFKIPALVLNGVDAGMILRAKEIKPQSSSKGGKKSFADAKTPAEEIVLRRMRETRNEELDTNKIHKDIQELLIRDEQFMEAKPVRHKDKLFAIQSAAFLLLERLFHGSEHVKPIKDYIPRSWNGGKAWDNIKKDYDTVPKALLLLEAAMKFNIPKHHFVPDSVDVNYKTDDTDIFTRAVMDFYIPDQVKQVEAKYAEKIGKRKDKLAKVIADLEEQQKQLDSKKKGSSAKKKK